MRRTVIFIVALSLAGLTAWADDNSDFLKAAESGDRKTIENILNRGAVKPADAVAVEALWEALSGKHYDLAEFLLGRGISVKKTPAGHLPVLSHVGPQGKKALTIMRALIAAGANVNEIDWDWNGWTPLFYAIMAGAIPRYWESAERYVRPEDENVDVVRLLIDNKADLNVQSALDGLSPLMTAARYDARAIVELLIEKGADGALKDKEGMTAANYLAVNGNARALKLLLSKGVNVKIFPLSQIYNQPHKSAGFYDVEVVKVMLDHGLQVNSLPAGSPLLHYPASLGAVEVVKLLLARGAKVDLVDGEGQTALMIAAQTNRLEAVKLLLASGANVNARDNKGKTALMLVADGYGYETAKLLIEQGAVVRLKAKDGRTVLDVARDRGTSGLFHFLKEELEKQDAAGIGYNKAAADAANNLGMEAYKHKDYAAAADHFRRAIEDFPNHKYANYNLACMLALLYKPGDPCSNSYHIGDVLQQLGRAVEIDPAWRTRALKDADFDSIKGTAQFMLFFTPNPAEAALVKRILVSASTWYKPAIGVEGPTTLQFSADGSFTFHRPVMTEDGVRSESDSGTYAVDKAGNITLRFKSGRKTTTKIVNGKIHVDELYFGITPDCGV